MNFSIVRYLSLVLVFLTISADSEPDDILVPNYDVPDLKIKFFEILRPLVLGCNVTTDEEAELVWKKNDIDVKEIESLQERFEIITKEQKFVIQKPKAEDDGRYSCVFKTIKKDFFVVAHPVVHLTSNTGVNEGEKLTIQCIVRGTDPEISWTLPNNVTIKETTGRYILEEGDTKVPNARFIIENAVLDDRGNYTCNAQNKATKLKTKRQVLDATFVRVRSKMAILWPSLGILAELFLLFGIIFISEKRCKKTEPEESESDSNTEQTPTKEGSEVRLRK